MPDHLKVQLGPFTDRYVLRGPIAKGGSATVYLADDLQRRRQVALKVATVAEWDQRRWRQERRNMERLRRLALSCVLVADDAGKHESGLAYFAMPLCLGGSLQDRIRQFGAISPAAALAVLNSVAYGLDEVHAAGLVHRDLKPANIMFAEADRTKWNALLSDWGIAQYVGDESLTTSHVIGSDRYMSPQRRAGTPATAADDQYGLAKTLEDALCGYRLDGRGDEETAVLPRALASVLKRAQERKPTRRYPS